MEFIVTAFKSKFGEKACRKTLSDVDMMWYKERGKMKEIGIRTGIIKTKKQWIFHSNRIIYNLAS